MNPELCGRRGPRRSTTYLFVVYLYSGGRKKDHFSIFPFAEGKYVNGFESPKLYEKFPEQLCCPIPYLGRIKPGPLSFDLAPYSESGLGG